MGEIYVINEDGSSTAVESIFCKDEAQELQRIIEANPNLIPGDQIDPDNPRNWLMIRREMPVPDPSNGENRWSIDFFFPDQDAIPTFVECKRHNDTRARREVVGQMLEYVANGHYYWSAAQLTSFAEESASKRNTSLDAVVAAIQGPGGISAAEYFARVEENLRSGRVRMIFVLEESSYELRSVVEFLNRQMEDSEVLLVEIRLYETGGRRIAIPVLFGYTERARAIKKSPAANASGEARRTWDESSFLEDAVTKIPQQAIEAIKMLLSSAQEHDWGIKWGTGRANGSISVRLPGVARRSLFSIYSNGTLVLNFGWLNENDVELAARSRLAEFSIATFGLTLPEQWEQKYVPLAPETWAAKMGQLVGFLASLVPASE